METKTVQVIEPTLGKLYVGKRIALRSTGAIGVVVQQGHRLRPLTKRSPYDFSGTGRWARVRWESGEQSGHFTEDLCDAPRSKRSKEAR